ncbi:YihY/virulence factor BrkB family protein [Sphingopyxis yananensis]|uniref:YihY/virulence factor BrkB family protein n=1 Tax=Sphingopyxis yananensis TaxID=2886687 RepID=UPI001D11CEA9|nr:YihY/virulence factor BrkB family protein [Sphingopyxis yananensis]MCC2602075.1 YihY/virulence factor BrkB family protein [Sphingopyxis yananensis]
MSQGQSPHSLEARAKAARKRKLVARAEGLIEKGKEHVGPGTRFFQIAKRVLVGTFTDGVIHAGNLAYLSLIALFPFFILIAAVLSLLGGGAGGERAIEAVLSTMPPAVAETLATPIREAMNARTGIFLWLGAIVALWSVGSLVETIRDILRRAYGVQASRSIFHYRLLSIGVIFGAVILLLVSFSAQVLISGVEQFLMAFLPDVLENFGSILLPRLISGLGMFLAIFLLFYGLTPSKFRHLKQCPKWPGALFTTLWWIAVTMALPPLLAGLLSYDMTYGSMAGVMVALFFFHLVGLGIVMGAELNAALVEVEDLGHDVMGREEDVKFAN